MNTTKTIIPRMGLGTFRLKDQSATDAVQSALELGYEHIDTAQIYDNEKAVGRGIARSGVERDALFVTTKVWYDRLRGDDLIRSLEESLDRLQLEQVDLALIHWPSPGNSVPMAEYITALNEARQRGLTRHIGVSNFTIPQLSEAEAAPGGDNIVTNQIEVHPYLANRKVVDYCQSKGVEVTGYMPLAVGKVMKDPLLQEIADNHGVTPAQIALAWVLSRNVAVIPSSTRPEHQRANLGALDIELGAMEIEWINGLDADERIANPSFAPVWDA